MTTLSGGGFVIVGDISPSGTAGAMWIVRLDEYGHIVWEKTYTDGYTFAEAVAEAANGDLLVVGAASPSLTDNDLLVLRLDPAGGIVCSRTYGGSGDDAGYSIQQTSSGNLIVAGETETYGAGGFDVWVLELDPDCNVLWQKSYGGTANDAPSSIREITGLQPGFVVAGTTQSFGAGLTDVSVMRLDLSGNVIWERTYGGSGFDRLGRNLERGTVRTVPGGFALAGTTGSFGGIAGDDLWFLLLDDAGAIQMERVYESTGIDGGTGLLPTSTGFVLSGIYDDGGFLGIGIDPTGAILWQKVYAPDSVFFLMGPVEVEATLDGGLIFAGVTLSYGAVQRDAFVVRTDADGEGHFSCPFTDSSLSVTASSAAVADTTATVQTTTDGGGAVNLMVANTVVTVDPVCAGPLCPVPDLDGDGILNEDDNCPTICNPSQDDVGTFGLANNGVGDACDGPGDRELFYGVAVSWGPDMTMDSVPSNDDVYVAGCPVIWAGPDGVTDTAAIGDDVQELLPGTPVDCDPVPGQQADSIADGTDNCPGVCNATQDDTDGDGIGDACCPGIIAGSDYCISGNSTGHDYSWGFDDDGDGAIAPPDPEIQNASTPPAGSPASDLASAFASSINLEGKYSANPVANCFTTTAPSTLWVGAAGQPASCKVTPMGCSYNPTIFCLTPAGSPVLGVAQDGADTVLSWTSLPTGSTYDVVRGDVHALRLTGGDFALATDECVADAHAENMLTFAADPTTGGAFWFLVRGSGCDGGTYDSESPAQAGSRDAGIDASGSNCP